MNRHRFRTTTISQGMREICDEEVRKLVMKRAAIETAASPRQFVCSIFVVRKSSGGHRPVINLKPLNRFVRYKKFKMKNFDSLLNLIRLGDWMAKVD